MLPWHQCCARASQSADLHCKLTGQLCSQSTILAGIKWGEASARAACQHCRTCRFDNVCLNHTSMEIQYFQSPEDGAPLFYDFSGRPHWSFPPDFVNTGVLPAVHVTVPAEQTCWECA